MYRLGWFDIKEVLPESELAMRLMYRAVPNVIGFSLFTRPWKNSNSISYTLVENSLFKNKSTYRWSEWFKDIKDKRDISAYLKFRWMMN